MAEDWRENPAIMAAREMSKKFHKKQVIVLMVGDDGLSGVSYGANKLLCGEAGRMLDVACEAVSKTGFGL